MKSIKNYYLLFLLINLNLIVKSYAQVEIDSLPASYSLAGYQLIYGNSGYDIEDFSLKNPDFPVLLSLDAGGANFVLLDNHHQKISELLVPSGTAKTNFWNDEQYYYYQPMLIYKSSLCPISHKAGIIKLEIVNKQLKFVECELLDKDYINKKYFEGTQNFKITYLDDDKKNPDKAEIGIAVNDKYYIRRGYPNTNLRGAGQLIPYVQINTELLFLDILAQDIYKISVDNKLVSKEKLKNNPFFADIQDTYWGYELMHDEIQNKTYLYGWSKQIKKLGRNTKIINQERKLWLLEDNSLTEVLDLKHLNIKKIKIRNGFIYASLGILDEDAAGEERFMFYKSKFQLN